VNRLETFDESGALSTPPRWLSIHGRLLIQALCRTDLE
jgi:hypothetical protein